MRQVAADCPGRICRLAGTSASRWYRYRSRDEAYFFHRFAPDGMLPSTSKEKYVFRVAKSSDRGPEELEDMRKSIAKFAISTAGMLLLTVVPAFATSGTLLTFSLGSGTGTWSGSGNSVSGSFDVTQLQELDVATGVTTTYNLAGGLFQIAFNNGTPSLTI